MTARCRGAFAPAAAADDAHDSGAHSGLVQGDCWKGEAANKKEAGLEKISAMDLGVCYNISVYHILL